jgi:hypothetical protein
MNEEAYPEDYPGPKKDNRDKSTSVYPKKDKE